MVNEQMVQLITGPVCLTIVAFFSMPALRGLAERAEGVEKLAKLYEDKDGTATEESEGNRSDAAPAIVIFSGTAVGLVSSVFWVAVNRKESGISASSLALSGAWSEFGTWMLLSLQVIGIIAEKRVRWRFYYGICAAITTLIIATSIILDLLWNVSTDVRTRLGTIQLAAALIAAGGFTSLRRQPDVFFNQKIVDQQYSVSIAGRYSFSWVTRLLYIARRRTLTLTDLPALDHYSRTKHLNTMFIKKRGKGKLWRLILNTFAGAFAHQWIMILMKSICGFSSRIVLHRFLQHLEFRRTDSETNVSGNDKVAWAWVVGLGLSLLLETVADNWMHWVTHTRLEYPIKALLNSLVFQKATRRQISHDPQSKDSESLKNGAEYHSRQSVINHVKSDAQRVSDACIQSHYFPMAFFKVLFDVTFLIRLIGLKSIIVGYGALIILIPLNRKHVKKFRSVHLDIAKTRDRKTNLLTETLQAIRQIRFLSLEQSWEDKILHLRDEELSLLWKRGKAMAAMMLCGFAGNLGSVLLASISLSFFAFQGGQLTPSIAFTSQELFQSILSALGALPFTGTQLSEAFFCCNRLEKYLNETEKADYIAPSEFIAFENATVAWPTDNSSDETSAQFELRNLTFTFPNNELSIIAGPTGSGKSLLLASILGEADLRSGTIKVLRQPSISARAATEWIIPESAALVSQPPWIEDCSVKENILFGLPLDYSRYQKVLWACALDRDLELFEKGDETEVGPGGVSLSGGQRWRIALARALYSRAGILILDDILSAVDTHVGKWIFENALTGELGQNRTRILVTHHVESCLSRAKYIIQLGTGNVDSAIIETPGAASRGKTGIRSQAESKYAKHAGSDGKLQSKNVQPLRQDREVETRNTELAGRDSKAQGQQTGERKRAQQQIPTKEKQTLSGVRWSVYLAYLQASGGWKLWSIGSVLTLAFELVLTSRSWLLMKWTARYSSDPRQKNNTRVSNNYGVFGNPDTVYHAWYYIGIYMASALLTSLLNTIQTCFYFIIGLTASTSLYRRMTHSILRAPLRWIDTASSGQILSRFTSNMDSIDISTAHDLSFFLDSCFRLFIVISTSLLSSRYLLIAGLGLLWVYVDVARHYLPGGQDFTRLKSITSAPMYDHFGSVISGLATIRAFDKTRSYVDQMSDLIDTHTSVQNHIILAQKWMTFRLGMIGAAFVTMVAAAIVTNGADAGLAGFAVTAALQYSGVLSQLLKRIITLEVGINAVERIMEYVELPTEPERGSSAPADWPTEGQISVENLVVGYDDHLPPTLKGISFTLKPNERLGVIGRTGAGKTTLAYSLLRFVEPRYGTICIDGVDISTLKLHDLRRRITIIPQDPFLFSGTLRSNLDLYGIKDDEELRIALQRVHLMQRPAVSTSPSEEVTGGHTFLDDLDLLISGGGMNLSHGQRQLICLARAILAQSKILVLDEATSSVDKATDSAIQRFIRTELSDSTLIVIAHRLSTVADFDKLLVLGDGAVLESGTPTELMRAKGVFWNMVCQSSERGQIETLISAD